MNAESFHIWKYLLLQLAEVFKSKTGRKQVLWLHADFKIGRVSVQNDERSDQQSLATC